MRPHFLDAFANTQGFNVRPMASSKPVEAMAANISNLLQGAVKRFNVEAVYQIVSASTSGAHYILHHFSSSDEPQKDIVQICRISHVDWHAMFVSARNELIIVLRMHGRRTLHFATYHAAGSRIDGLRASGPYHWYLHTHRTYTVKPAPLSDNCSSSCLV